MFESILARADDETLQDLVGRPVLRLLQALDPSLARPSSIRSIIHHLSEPADLLRDSHARALLVGLLRPEEASELASNLGYESGSPYEDLWSLRLRPGSDLEQDFFAWFGVSTPPPVLRDRTSESTETPMYSLFDHQRNAVRKVLTNLGSGARRTVLHMPTGAGKTRTAMNAVSQVLRREEPALVVWLAYSEELCQQAVEEFQRAWGFFGDRAMTVYRFWGGRRRPPIDEMTDGFVVASLATMYAIAQRDGDYVARMADRASMVVIDEAHQAIAETYRFVLEFLTERNRPATSLLGLTATPGRTWNDPDIDEELAEFFDRRKVTLEVEGYENPVDYLIDNGYLAKPEFRNVPFSSREAWSSRELESIAESLDIGPEVLQRLAEDEQRNLLIVHEIEGLLRYGHHRILVFAATLAHARVLAAVLVARGTNAAAVTGQTPPAERARLIAKYLNEDSEPRILTNFGVLTAGFDAPRTSAAVIARPTKSLVLYSQMVGRATRGPKAGGNEAATIVTVVDTELPGFGDMAEAFMNWEDVWDE